MGGVPSIIYTAAAAGAYARGAFIVVLAWAALVLTNDKAKVGQVLVVWSVLALFVGPFAGALIDRIDRKRCVIFGQALVVLGIAFPVAAALATGDLTIWHLFGSSVIWAFGNLFVVGSFDAIVQGAVPMDQRRKVGARLGGVRQAAMVAGTGISGLVVHGFGILTGFTIAAASGAIMLLVIFALPRAAAPSVRRSGKRYLEDLREGCKYLAASPTLVSVSLIGILGFSAGQVTNAVLPGYIREDMHAGSDIYGFADAGWAVGGVVASMTVAVLIARYRMYRIDVYCLCLVGFMMMFMWANTSIMAMIVMQVLMGSCASITKSISDGNVLALCSEESIGRVRSLTQAITGLIGIAIYFSPTFLTQVSASQFYLIWGGIFAAFAALNMVKNFRKPTVELRS